MESSPLQFAKDFARLKSKLAAAPAADLRLLLLVDFWPQLEICRRDAAYQSYFDEYLPLLSDLITEENLADLTMAELAGLRRVLAALNDAEKTSLVTVRLATLYFYVGQLEAGLRLCAELAGETVDSAALVAEDESLNEFDAFRHMYQRIGDNQPRLREIVKHIDDTWEAVRGAYSFDRANSLFVEKDGTGRATRGRMKVLKGSVELAKKSASEDHVSFDNQVRSPDDPFVGVAYDSLEAVRRIFRRDADSETAGRFYHAHFAIVDSSQTFTGDSIGLAIGLVTYAQLLSPQVLRLERFVSAEVAFTGGVDTDGNLTPVSSETLPVKIERAFFSPVKYVVLPEANLPTAKKHLDKLREEYPRRHLLLIGAERLADVIEDHNVIRSEKVCIGEFITKIVYKYSRTAKIQVPILLALLYLMICLIYPKAWLGFDWNPEYVKLTETGFVALNADSVSLWSVEYECKSIYARSKWKVGDLDDDDRNEIAFIPHVPESASSESNNRLFVYDHDGDLLFKRNCAICGEYPGDTSPLTTYAGGGVDFIRTGDSSIIITSVCQSYPSRSHIRFWSASGGSLGWYVNAGMTQIDSDRSAKIGEGCVFLGINNRMGCASLFILPLRSAIGVSPPYHDPVHNLENVKRGNQVCYILFPLHHFSPARPGSLPFRDTLLSIKRNYG